MISESTRENIFLLMEIFESENVLKCGVTGKKKVVEANEPNFLILPMRKLRCKETSSLCKMSEVSGRGKSRIQGFQMLWKNTGFLGN